MTEHRRDKTIQRDRHKQECGYHRPGCPVKAGFSAGKARERMEGSCSRGTARAGTSPASGAGGCSGSTSRTPIRKSAPETTSSAGRCGTECTQISPLSQLNMRRAFQVFEKKYLQRRPREGLFRTGQAGKRTVTQRVRVVKPSSVPVAGKRSAR